MKNEAIGAVAISGLAAFGLRGILPDISDIYLAGIFVMLFVGQMAVHYTLRRRRKMVEELDAKPSE